MKIKKKSHDGQLLTIRYSVKWTETKNALSRYWRKAILFINFHISSLFTIFETYEKLIISYSYRAPPTRWLFVFSVNDHTVGLYLFFELKPFGILSYGRIFYFHFCFYPLFGWCISFKRFSDRQQNKLTKKPTYTSNRFLEKPTWPIRLALLRPGSDLNRPD